MLALHQEAASIKHNLSLLAWQTQLFSYWFFNLNYYLNFESVASFWIKKEHTGIIVYLLSWYWRVTSRGHYILESVTGECIVLRSLFCPIRLLDMKSTFGTRSLRMCKIFWKVIQQFTTCRTRLLNLRHELWVSRASVYPECIKNLKNFLTSVHAMLTARRWEFVVQVARQRTNILSILTINAWIFSFTRL